MRFKNVIIDTMFLANMHILIPCVSGFPKIYNLSRHQIDPEKVPSCWTSPSAKVPILAIGGQVGDRLHYASIKSQWTGESENQC